MNGVLTPRALTDIARLIDDDVRVDHPIRFTQGAVATVTALRDSRGTRYVVKVYRPEFTAHLETENQALRLIASRTDIRAPTPIGTGIIEDQARPFLLLSYLPGQRWSDRRDRFTADDWLRLAEARADLLGGIHTITGTGFGPLPRPTYTSAWSHLQHRSQVLVTDYLTHGGNKVLAATVERLIDQYWPHFSTGRTPVLCHEDFVDNNLIIVQKRDGYELAGVVDLEAATWNDPIADVAKGARDLSARNPAAADRFLQAYGATSDADRTRLLIHHTLQTVHERAWISADQPHRWQDTADMLDNQLRAFTDELAAI